MSDRKNDLIKYFWIKKHYPELADYDSAFLNRLSDTDLNLLVTALDQLRRKGEYARRNDALRPQRVKALTDQDGKPIPLEDAPIADLAPAPDAGLETINTPASEKDRKKIQAAKKRQQRLRKKSH
jgi:hypothetical protein